MANNESGNPAAGDAATAVASAMARAQAITTHPAAKGREALAAKLAFETTGLSTEQAVALLEASPAAAAAPAAPAAAVPPIAARAPGADVAALGGAAQPVAAAADPNALWNKVLSAQGFRPN